MPSNIPRCKHGVYDPHGDGYGCQFCNSNLNNGHKAEPKNFVMPKRILTEQDGHVRSNKHSPGHCPECGSAIHSLIGLGSWWRCEECGTDYRAPKRALRGAA